MIASPSSGPLPERAPATPTARNRSQGHGSGAEPNAMMIAHDGRNCVPRGDAGASGQLKVGKCEESIWHRRAKGVQSRGSESLL